MSLQRLFLHLVLRLQVVDLEDVDVVVQVLQDVVKRVELLGKVFPSRHGCRQTVFSKCPIPLSLLHGDIKSITLSTIGSIALLACSSKSVFMANSRLQKCHTAPQRQKIATKMTDKMVTSTYCRSCEIVPPPKSSALHCAWSEILFGCARLITLAKHRKFSSQKLALPLMSSRYLVM